MQTHTSINVLFMYTVLHTLKDYHITNFSDCGFIAHLKCSERVPSHCVPDLKKLRGVFGIDLTTLLNAHSSTLPFVVKKCVNEIESRGMDSEGIYRVSGFADEIEALKLAFDKGKAILV